MISPRARAAPPRARGLARLGGSPRAGRERTGRGDARRETTCPRRRDDAASWGSSRTAWRRRVWRARAVSAVHAARTKGGAALTCLTPNSILAMPGRKTMYGMLALQAFSNYVTRGALAPMIQ